jgi:hypothetical protein
MCNMQNHGVGEGVKTPIPEHENVWQAPVMLRGRSGRVCRGALGFMALCAGVLCVGCRGR